MCNWRFHCCVPSLGQRSAKVMAKALSAGFQRALHRIRPLPVGSSERTVRYMHLSAACSSGKWPRARMERLFTALQEERIIAVEVRVPALDSTSVKVHRHAVRVCK